MSSAATKTLSKIRQRRLDNAQIAKAKKQHELELAAKTLTIAEHALVKAKEDAKRKINQLYTELLKVESCNVTDIEKIRTQEALLIENIVKLKHDIKEAEATKQKATEELEQERKQLIKANLAKEAINLIEDAELKQEKLIQNQQEDALIDEVAELQSFSKKS